MLSATQTASFSNTQPVRALKAMLWAGRIITGLVVAFLLFDSGIKALKLAPAVEGTARLGYPVTVVLPLGIALLVCTVLYVIPRASILGAILLTGYLGGATASLVRLEDHWFLFPGGFAVLVWGGLFSRDERLRALIPLRR